MLIFLTSLVAGTALASSHSHHNVSLPSFINGLNLPWVNCGNDYGIDSYPESSFNDAFQRYCQSGANSARVWIHYDTNKVYKHYDSNGQFKPLSQNFLDDFGKMMRAAQRNKVQVFLTLFSFECVNYDPCHNMMLDNNKRDAYIRNGLRPLLDYVKKNGLQNTVTAVEMFNEPEWMIVGGSGVSRQIGKESVQNFVRACNQVITGAGFAATVGSASLKWTCNCGHWCEGDWWGNTGITFYTVHYYSWMAQGGNTYDPFHSRPSDWCLSGKPVLIGESPAWTDASTSGQLTVWD